MVLWQESLAPGADELQQLDFGDGGVSSLSVRGHTIFVAPRDPQWLCIAHGRRRCRRCCAGTATPGLCCRPGPSLAGSQLRVRTCRAHGALTWSSSLPWVSSATSSSRCRRSGLPFREFSWEAIGTSCWGRRPRAALGSLKLGLGRMGCGLGCPGSGRCVGATQPPAGLACERWMPSWCRMHGE